MCIRDRTYVGSHTMLNLNQYFIKVTGSSNTTAGAYLLTVAEKPFNVNYGNLVINEIHYNPATSQGYDSVYEFLELYNISSADIDLMGMTVGQAGSTTSIASLDSVTIGAGSYVVVAYTGATYSSLTVPVVNKGGYFGLSNSGKAIELLDSTGAIVDFVTYDDYSPWPTLPDGGGPSLELVDATKDNNVASNWRGHGKNGGTPGVANSAQPDISMGSSITSYVGAGTSSSSNFQLKNNGDSGLTVDSVVAKVFVPGTSFLSEGFEGGIPTTWTATAISGSYNWAQSSTYAKTGTYSAYYNSYSAYYGYSAELVSASIDLSSANNPSLGFAYLHPTTASYYTDSITVYASSDDGTNWTRVGGPYMLSLIHI